MSDSLLSRKTCITRSQVSLKLPSMPEASKAFTSMRVRRNGTCRMKFVRERESGRARERRATPYTFGILVTQHGHFEAIAKVNVDELAGASLEHDVGRVPVSEAEDVAHHGHHLHIIVTRV